MLQGQSHDDVLELCRSVPMDPNLYKRFEFAVSTRSVSTGEVTDPQQDNGTAGVAGSSESPSPGLGASNAVASVATKPQPLAAAPSRLEDEIPKLLLAQEPAVPTAALMHAGDVRPATLPPEAIGSNLSALAAVHTRTFEGPALLPVISGVGGAGATTVLAGLGRALSILGERVLLVDARGPSTLDCFYQSNTTKTSLLLSTGASSQFEGGVHVLRTHADAPSGNQSYSTKFCRATAGLSGHIDHILVGGTDWFAPALESRAWSGGFCLFVLTPELRSVMAVPSLLKSVAERSRKSGRSIEPWFILNRFMDSSAMHATIRARLTAQLGHRLLPFCFPETELVEQALMREINVLDFAPESAFADTCFNLAEWYRAISTENSARLSSPAEETQLVSERS